MNKTNELMDNNLMVAGGKEGSKEVDKGKGD